MESLPLPQQNAAMRAAVDIGHLGARVDNEGALLEAVADLFQSTFGLHAVQLYLIDASGLFGELRFHAGAGDRKTLFRTPGVPIGGGNELSQTLERGAAHAIQDMRSLARTAVPQGSQSALALPLNVEGRMAGALVLFQQELDAFGPSDISSFTSLADMVALALDNVRLRQRGRHATPPSKRTPGDKSGIELGTGPLSGLREPIRFAIGEGESAEETGHATPIQLQGSVVGSMRFQGQGGREFDPEEVELIDGVADQVAQAIENLSLVANAQRLAEREQTINAISAQLQRATSVEGVLRAAAEAVQVALGNVEVTARLSPAALNIASEVEATGDGGEA